MFKRLLRIAGIATFVAATTVAVAPSAFAQASQPQLVQAQRNLGNLMDALAKLRPGNAELANRAAKIKEQLGALAPAQMAVVAPALTEPEFTAAVERLGAVAATVQTARALRGDLDGAEYDSCGNVRSDTDSGRALVIAADSLNIAAIIGDVACNSIVVILGEGSNLPGCIVAGVLHEAVQGVNFERDLRNYCDGVIEGNETRGILKNTNLILNDLSAHDAEIKALLATLQRSVDEANQRLKVAEALARQSIKLLLTPEGLRNVDPAVMTCSGDNCPKPVLCPGAECSFPIKK
jgi:hypothetical protein